MQIKSTCVWFLVLQVLKSTSDVLGRVSDVDTYRRMHIIPHGWLLRIVIHHNLSTPGAVCGPRWRQISCCVLCTAVLRSRGRRTSTCIHTMYGRCLADGMTTILARKSNPKEMLDRLTTQVKTRTPHADNTIRGIPFVGLPRAPIPPAGVMRFELASTVRSTPYSTCLGPDYNSMLQYLEQGWEKRTWGLTSYPQSRV